VPEPDHRAPDTPLPASPDLRVGAASARGDAFTFHHRGQAITAYPGETIGAALLAGGIRQLRTTGFDARPRGLFCGIGACFDCLVTVDGDGPVRACLAPATPDTEVEVHHVVRQR